MENLEDKLRYRHDFNEGSEFVASEVSGILVSHMTLTRVYFVGVSFLETDLEHMTFRACSFKSCRFTHGSLSNVDFLDSTFPRTEWVDCSMHNVHFTGSDLSYASFSNTHFGSVDFTLANISGTQGIPTQREFLSRFEKTDAGIIVYKSIAEPGQKTSYPPPPHWNVREGEYLFENCERGRHIECACGINFSTEDWCRLTYPYVNLWRCLIEWEDLADLTVPFEYGEKARCSRLKLLEVKKPDSGGHRGPIVWEKGE